MKSQLATPSLPLQPFIKHYWSIENELGTNKVHIQRVIATGLPELVFHFEDIPKTSQRNLEGNAILNAQQNDYYDLLIRGHLSMFAITFQPQGLSHFLSIPLHELQNQSFYLGLFDKAFSQKLEDQLSEAKSFHKRVEITERHFIQALSRQNITTDHQRMAKTIELIKATKGKVKIDQLAAISCLSRKQFERKFIAHIGITPKQFLKIVRFQNAIYLNHFSNNLTDLGYQAGYYDQSHFIKEAKELTGYTPNKLFKNCEMVSDFFQ